MALLALHNVTKRFPVRRGFLSRAKEFIRAVDGVSLTVEHGEVFGLVGESGCGKSTLGRIAGGLYRPDSGDVVFSGDARDRQMIFQDPFSSLDPRMRVGDIVTEPLVVRGGMTRKERMKKAEELLVEVGLEPHHLSRYPHEFSGGQRQRICIARAVSIRPKFIVADEPVSSLDVAVQADILGLLKRLQERFGMAYLFVSHDLRIVSSLCTKVAVMYLGKIVELLPSGRIRDARHPYTEALISAVPVADPRKRTRRIILSGDVPSPVNPPSGCRFHPRCPYKEDICEREEPVLEIKTDGGMSACHFAEKVGKGRR